MKRSIWPFLIVLFCLPMSPAFSSDPIKIGAIYSKSGEAKSISEEHLISTRFAVEEINRNGGILGRQIQLIEFNNESSGLGSLQAAKRAVQENVAAVLGPSWSSVPMPWPVPRFCREQVSP